MRDAPLLFVVGLAIAALPLAASAQESDDDERARREAEIFGASPSPNSGGPENEGEEAIDDENDTVDGPSMAGPAERSARERREDELFGAPPATGVEVQAEGGSASPLEAFTPPRGAPGAEVLRDLDRVLDIGGRAYLALQYTHYLDEDDGVSLFPALSSPSLLNLYADARPSSRLRAYAEARLDYDFTAADSTAGGITAGDLTGGDTADGVTPGVTPFPRTRQQLRLDQLWLKLDAARVAYLTLGKQRIRWGTGRFWNPTDFLNQQVRDPLDVFDRRLGVTLAKAHFPLEELGSNLYLIGDLANVTAPDDIGLAARAEALIGNTELTTTASVKRGQPLRFGADVSSALWVFDVRAEGAATFGSDQPFFEGDVDLARGVVPTEVRRANDWIFQLVLGGEVAIPYSSTDSAIVGAEYFFNDAGYERADLYPVLFARQAFRPLYVGRHYAAVYGALPQPGPLDDSSVLMSTVGNLSDQSFLTRVDFSTLVLTFLTLNVWATVHYGNEGELRLGLTLPPTPGLPGAEDGVRVAPPLIDVGGAVTLDF